MRRTAAFIAVLVAGILIPATGNGAKPKHKAKTYKVAVGDDFFAPITLKVKKNDKINWKWDATNTDTHNVQMSKGPKGVKKGCKTKGPDAFSPLISKCNKSSFGAVGIKFKKTMNVKGTYTFICAIHPTVMKMTVKVGK
jgi:plastocyanin